MGDQPYTIATADVELRHPKTLDDLDPETREALERASIVLVPDEGFRDYAGPVFPDATVDFFQFLREHAPSSADVAIATEDTGYKEVVLHSDIVRLATLFVEYAAAPIAVHLIGAYLKDFLTSRFGRAEARTTIVVHRKEGAREQTVRISYEGPAQNVEAALAAAIASLPTRPSETPPVGTTVAPQPAQPKAPKLGTTTQKKRPRK